MGVERRRSRSAPTCARGGERGAAMKRYRTRRLGVTLAAAIGALVLGTLAGTVGVAAGPVMRASAAGLPAGATDATKVPHYFGPWPNWANSPYTTSTAQVSITDSANGSGAEGRAQVDPVTGAVSSIEVTAPGHGYDPATTTVTVTGGSADAIGSVSVAPGGAVVGVDVSAPGSGYSSLAAEATGGGGTGATLTASGGVDAVTITDGGTGYTMPTVDFDLPDTPDGTIAKAHVPMISNGDTEDGMTPDGVVTTVVLDEPGSGYTKAPQVGIHNGTLADPVNGATEATATSTLQLGAVTVANPGSGYTSAPDVTVSDPTGSGTGAAAVATTDTGAITAIAVSDGGAGFLSKG